jgi:excisionase family DNA binding protein
MGRGQDALGNGRLRTVTIEPHYKGKALASLLSVNPETIRRAAAAGTLRSVRVGSERRYPESAVKEWLESLSEGKAAA